MGLLIAVRSPATPKASAGGVQLSAPAKRDMVLQVSLDSRAPEEAEAVVQEEEALRLSAGLRHAEIGACAVCECG